MKKFLPIFIILVLLMTISSCTKNDLEEYKRAVEKTNQIKKGQMLQKVDIQLDFNLDGLTPEEIKNLNYFSKIELNLDMTFDDEREKMISRNYYSFGGIGFDSTFYIDKEKMYIKMPMVGKYLVISDFLKSKLVDINEEKLDLSEIIKSLENNWLKLLNKENVFSGEKTILSTPNGEVKTTHFSIKLNDPQIKEFINSSLDIISQDKELIKMIEDSIIKGKDNKERIDANKYLKNFKEYLKDCEIESYKQDSYIDIDGYIVQEDIEIKIKFNNDESGSVKEQTIKVQIKNWDIGKEQKFNFPELNNENTLDIKNIEQGIPFIFEDLVN